MTTKTFLIFLLNIVLINLCLASTSTNLESTANAQIQTPLIPAQIYLTEINLKNSQQDYLKFRVHSSNNNATINLKGLQFYDDTVFKTITNDYIIPSDSIVKLNFNQTATDSPTNLELYTTHSGLTSTTEQILIKQQDYYYDFFCWQKAPLTASEIKDFQNIFHTGFWSENDPASCFDSSLIAKDQSLIRLNSEHDSDAWTTNPPSTATTPTPILTSPPPSSSPTTASTTSEKLTENTEFNLPEESPLPANFFVKPSPTPATVKSTKTSKSTTKTTSKTKSTTLTNLDSSTEPLENSPLEITEIFPAPSSGKKADEWVEIHNNSDSTINLKNWIIDDEEGGSKPHLLPNQNLEPQQYFLLNSEETKLNLNNTKDQVRLFNPEKVLADLIQYSETPKNLSYSKISIDEQSEWLWTKDSTPGQANQIYQKILGTISSEPVFAENYSFTIQDQEKIPYQIQFSEDLIKAPQAKIIFKTGLAGEFIGIMDNSKTPAILNLKKYQITNSANEENYSPLLAFGGIILLVLIISYFLLKNKFPWKTSISSSPS